MATKKPVNKKTDFTKKQRNQQQSKQLTEAGRSNRSTTSKSAVVSTKKKTTKTKTTETQTSRNGGATKPAVDKSPSGIDLAAQVLAESDQPLSAKAIAERVIKAGWQTDGKTPHATLYSSIIREIKNNGDASRFKKVDRGQFTLNSKKGGGK